MSWLENTVVASVSGAVCFLLDQDVPIIIPLAAAAIALSASRPFKYAGLFGAALASYGHRLGDAYPLSRAALLAVGLTTMVVSGLEGMVKIQVDAEIALGK